MRNHKRVLMVSALCLLAAGGLAGCSGNGGGDVVRATEAPPTVVGQDLIQTTATVQDINYKTRMVTLRGVQGQTATVKVNDPAIDLTKVKKGDVVDLAYYNALAVNVVGPGEAAPGVTGVSDRARSRPGEAPATGVVDQTTVTARVIEIDQLAHTVTFQGPEGGTRTVQVRNPELQQKMKGLKVGDLVQFTFTEAIAARLQPRAAR